MMHKKQFGVLTSSDVSECVPPDTISMAAVNVNSTTERQNMINLQSNSLWSGALNHLIIIVHSIAESIVVTQEGLLNKKRSLILGLYLMNGLWVPLQQEASSYWLHLD